MAVSAEDRVYAPESDEEVPCMWFAKCANPANGLRDAGPLGQIPICVRCNDRMERLT